uniref:ANAPC4_WD40 domain-containing protein n=1 Tax=Steinernema glaseri TaxID=37863 RepID=A0A1I8A7G8_9BILA
MAVLVEDRVGEALPNVDPRENSLLQWHEQRDLLAVASYCDATGGEVNFFTKKGGKSKTVYNCERHARISSLAWNPVLPIIAVGWTNGVAALFDVQRNEVHGILLYIGIILP